MQKRIITGIIGIICLLLVIYILPVYYFYLLLLSVLIISHYEFFNLFQQEKFSKKFILSILVSVYFIISFSLNEKLALISIILFFLVLFTFLIGKKDLPEMLKFLIANIYISIFLCLSIPIFNNGEGKHLIMFLLIIAWCTDSFAYFTGVKFGKRKLCPSISPNKTIEGAIGGLIGAIIAGLLFNLLVLKVNFLKAFTYIIILSIFSILGDLFESSLKRYNNKKDSGNIFPGHGGMLDRIDSLFFSIPAFYILNNLLK